MENEGNKLKKERKPNSCSFCFIIMKRKHERDENMKSRQSFCIKSISLVYPNSQQRLQPHKTCGVQQMMRKCVVLFPSGWARDVCNVLYFINEKNINENCKHLMIL